MDKHLDSLPANRTRGQASFRGRLLGTVLLLLPWLILALLAAEVYEYMTWNAIRSSRYVKLYEGQRFEGAIRGLPEARQAMAERLGYWPGEESRPHFEADARHMEQLRAAAEQYGPAPPLLEVAPPLGAAPEPERTARRIAFHYSLTRDELDWFDTGFGGRGLRIGRDGLIADAYLARDFALNPLRLDRFIGKPLEDYMWDKEPRAQLEAMIARAVKTGSFQQELFDYQKGFGGRGTEVTVLPAYGPDGEVTGAYFWRQQRDEVESDLWNIAYYRYKPGYVSEFGNTEINSHGFRDAEIVMPKPKGVYRIICIGASTTQEGGWNATTYPAFLERKLNEYCEGPGVVDVVNAGITGADSRSLRARFLDFLALQPDLILYGMSGDTTPYILPRWTEEAAWWQKLLRRSQALNRYFHEQLIVSPEKREAILEASPLMENLRLIREYAGKHGVHMALYSFAHPSWEYADPEERALWEYTIRSHHVALSGKHVRYKTYDLAVDLLNERIERFCEAHDIQYIPVAENIEGGVNYFQDMAHMRSPGRERKAEICFQALKEHVREGLAAKMAAVEEGLAR